jgi:hypothetical protein
MTCADEPLFALWVAITLLGRARTYPDMVGVVDVLLETEAALFGILRTLGQADQQERLARFVVRGQGTAQ